MGNFFKWKLLSYTLVSVFCSTNTFAKDCFSKDWSKFHEIKDDEFNLRKGQPEERLANSQDFWNKYIEHHCTVDIDFDGSIASSFYNECIAEKTKERIKELQKLQ